LGLQNIEWIHLEPPDGSSAYHHQAQGDIVGSQSFSSYKDPDSGAGEGLKG
jgi:hypothetical protein